MGAPCLRQCRFLAETSGSARLPKADIDRGRPDTMAGAAIVELSDLGLLGNLESVIYLYAEVTA